MNNKNSKSDVHKIRPAARIIDTLGKGLIKDDLAAVIELVKNAYDADSTDAEIKFEYISTQNTLVISIQDHGHGMDYETIVNKWLVPGTSDKLERKISPKRKRQLQGRKGIGRYAAGILGQELFLSTTDEIGMTTELLMDWTSMTKLDYLDEVEVLVERKKTNLESGTYIEIRNRLDDLEEKLDIVDIWPDKKIDKLNTELKKLLTPVAKRSKDKFIITLRFGDFPSDIYANSSSKVDPIPLLELFDYRISGSISKTGKASIIYENQNLKAHKQETVNLIIKDSEYLNEAGKKACGKLGFDIRVFDRDPEAIDDTIKRAKSLFKLNLGKRDTK